MKDLNDFYRKLPGVPRRPCKPVKGNSELTYLGYDLVNYRTLLKKYMNHVGICEGVYCISYDDNYTEEEFKALEEIEKELE